MEIVGCHKEDIDLLSNIDKLINLVKAKQSASRQAKEILENAIKQLEDKGVDCIILGCTELPLILRAQPTSINTKVPLIDSTVELVKRTAIEVCKAMKPAKIAHLMKKLDHAENDQNKIVQPDSDSLRLHGFFPDKSSLEFSKISTVINDTSKLSTFSPGKPS